MIALGPVASQEAIKQLGTNGGGFFNVNAAHPFEEPERDLRTILNIVAMLGVSAALRLRLRPDGRRPPPGRWAFARGDRHPAAAGAGAAIYWAETQAIRSCPALGVDPCLGNMEGKEVRFGAGDGRPPMRRPPPGLSDGGVNGMHGSFTRSWRRWCRCS